MLVETDLAVFKCVVILNKFKQNLWTLPTVLSMESTKQCLLSNICFVHILLTDKRQIKTKPSNCYHTTKWYHRLLPVLTVRKGWICIRVEGRYQSMGEIVLSNESSFLFYSNYVMIVSDFYLRNRTETEDSLKLLANELNVLNCTRRWIVCLSENSELQATITMTLLFNNRR